jgi:hypothetical protein
LAALMSLSASSRNFSIFLDKAALFPATRRGAEKGRRRANTTRANGHASSGGSSPARPARKGRTTF